MWAPATMRSRMSAMNLRRTSDNHGTMARIWRWTRLNNLQLLPHTLVKNLISKIKCLIWTLIKKWFQRRNSCLWWILSQAPKKLLTFHISFIQIWTITLTLTHQRLLLVRTQTLFRTLMTLRRLRRHQDKIINTLQRKKMMMTKITIPKEGEILPKVVSSSCQLSNLNKSNLFRKIK